MLRLKIVKHIKSEDHQTTESPSKLQHTTRSIPKTYPVKEGNPYSRPQWKQPNQDLKHTSYFCEKVVDTIAQYDSLAFSFHVIRVRSSIKYYYLGFYSIQLTDKLHILYGTVLCVFLFVRYVGF